MNRKRFIALVPLLLVVAFFAASCAIITPVPVGAKHLAIVDTSDIHSFVLPYEATVIKDDGTQVKMLIGGMDHIAAVAKREREVTDGTLLVASGDILMGNFYRIFGGVPEITSMNLSGYDVVTPGNHDFDFGVDFYKKAMKNAAFPIVCSNITFEDKELSSRVVPYIIKEVGGIKVGIFGLMTPDLVRVSSVGPTVTVDPDLTSVSIEMVRTLREKGADIVVALTHTGKLLDEDLAREVAGIDIIVGGHSHDTFYEKIKGPNGWKTVIVQAGVYGREAGVLSFDVAGGRVTRSRWELVLMDAEAGSDPTVAAYLSPYKAKMEESLKRPVGETLVDLDAMSADVRSKENNLGDLVADAWADRFARKGNHIPSS